MHYSLRQKHDGQQHAHTHIHSHWILCVILRSFFVKLNSPRVRDGPERAAEHSHHAPGQQGSEGGAGL